MRRLAEKKRKKLILKVSRAIAEVFNESPLMSVTHTMEILGVAVYVYITMVNQDLHKEED